MTYDYCVWTMTAQWGVRCQWLCTRHGEMKTTYDGRG